MSKKILYANIKIPVEILLDGSISPFKEYIDVEFTECNSLPEIKKNIDYSFVMNKLAFFMKKESVSEVEPKIEQVAKPEVENKVEAKPEVENKVEAQPEKIILISKEYIKTGHSRPVTSSFKKRQYKHRHTAKQH
jgi:hypothetical protein